MKAIGIEWDIDEEYEDVVLPTEMEIPEETVKGARSLDEAIEAASDYITDETGFCHCGFETVLTDEEEKLFGNVVFNQ